MLITVLLSVVASNTISRALSLVTVYVAVAFTFPGKPFSPSGAVIANVTEVSVFAVISYTLFIQPVLPPPCRQFPLSF